MLSHDKQKSSQAESNLRNRIQSINQVQRAFEYMRENIGRGAMSSDSLEELGIMYDSSRSKLSSRGDARGLGLAWRLVNLSEEKVLHLLEELLTYQNLKCPPSWGAGAPISYIRPWPRNLGGFHLCSRVYMSKDGEGVLRQTTRREVSILVEKLGLLSV